MDAGRGLRPCKSHLISSGLIISPSPDPGMGRGTSSTQLRGLSSSGTRLLDSSLT